MQTTWTTIDGVEWISDTDGNRCSVNYFGSKEAAERALLSLKRCKNCINCSYCSDCSYCSGCSDCSGCSGCSDCSDCSYVANLRLKRDLQGDPDQKGNPTGQPPIPKIPNIDATVLAAIDTCDLKLRMDSWNTCNTTHCRAGMVVHLAGEAGYALERYHNTALAAQLIYRESGSPINPGRFYDSDAAAMADMRKRASSQEA